MKTRVLSVNAKYSLKDFLADAPWMNLLLDQLGLNLRDELQVSGKRQLVSIIEEAAKNCNLLVIIDGSEDFYSKNILSQGFGKELCLNETAAKTITEHFACSYGTKPNQKALSYAQMPEGAIAMLNPTGAEQGFALVYASICIAVLPAGKDPLQAIVPDQLYPLLLKSMYNKGCTVTIPLKQERIKEVQAYLNRSRRAKGFLPILCETKNGVVLRLTAVRQTEAESRQCCDSFLEDLTSEEGNVTTIPGVGRHGTKAVNNRKKSSFNKSFYDEPLDYEEDTDEGEETESYQFDENENEKEDEKDEKDEEDENEEPFYDGFFEGDDFEDDDLEGSFEENETKRRAKKLTKGNEKKKRTAFDKVRGFLLMLCALVFLGAGGYLGWYYYQSMQNRSNYENLREVYDIPGFAPNSYPEGYDKDFSGLWAINQDIVGWIGIDGTALDYPVVQAKDNEKYYRQNFEGKYSEHGVPFLDYAVDLKAPSRNTLVYGHNIRTDGQMFNILKEYKDLEYYRQHPIVDFNSVYRKGKYKIFSIFYSSTHPEHGEAFPYHEFVNSGGTEQTQRFIDEVSLRSVINTGVDVLPSDQLLTLSTCSYEFKDARYVVIARRVRDGESETVDTSQAVKNPNPLYPDIWYNLFGGTKPAISTSVNFSSGNKTTPATTETLPETKKPKTDTTTKQPETQPEEPKKEPQEEPQKENSEPQEPQPKEETDASDKTDATTEKKIIKKKSEAEIPEEEVLPSKEEPQPEEDAISAEVKTITTTMTLQTFGNEVDAIVEKPEKGKAQKKIIKNRSSEEVPEIRSDNAAQTTENKPANPSPAADVRVKVNGKTRSGSAQEIIASMVEAEMGSSFQKEALKAQAVAAYSYVRFHNNLGQTPQVVYKMPISNEVYSAVQEVLGVGVYYNGKFANSTYSASNAGMSCSSKNVWGGDLPYLVSVESPGDTTLKAYGKKETFSVDKIASNIKSYCKVDPYSYGNPEDWFSNIVYGDGIYIKNIDVCGKTISGREAREGLMKFEINSSAFDVETDGDQFTFTTYGYGHGVGMSQQGADCFAMEGWDYQEILSHYFSDTEIR